MDKRYQVFVSSTYADLKEERQRVMQTLMEMDCIPAGMELFPALDEEQFNFIKRVIDDCDYYLLIVGGRYGSLTEKGISYTEQEFDYANDKGLRIIALLHGDPQAIAVGKTDNDPELARRLNAFRAKAESGRLVKYWSKVEELPGLVSLSLMKTIKTYPAIGWVRANAGSAELLSEMNALRKENAALREKLAGRPASALAAPNLAGLDEEFVFTGKYNRSYAHKEHWSSFEVCVTWGGAFALIAPMLMKQEAESVVEVRLRKALLDSKGISYYESRFASQVFDTFKVQLRALGLVKIVELRVTAGGTALFWSLTESGEAEMVRRRAIRAANSTRIASNEV